MIKANETKRTPPYFSREELHRHFGGTVYLSDFDTENRNKHNISSPIALRIEADSRRFATAWNQHIIGGNANA